jgi:hypothetical protein
METNGTGSMPAGGIIAGRRDFMAAGVGFVATLILNGCGGSDIRSSSSSSAQENATVPIGANASNPSAPFYVDLTGLDLTTQPSTRTARAPSYPTGATTLETGQLPPINATGNFIVGSTRTNAPETVEQPGVPKGHEVTFTMTSADSTFYNPGWVRDETSPDAAVFQAQIAPGDPSNLIITTSHAGRWTRTVNVDIPARYVAGIEAPFTIANDGGLWPSTLYPMLDNLIFQKRIPRHRHPDRKRRAGCAGKRARREYDTVDDTYARFVQEEVLPRVEQNAGVNLTADPEGRSTMGASSGVTAAFSMAWFHPEWFRRVLGYSPSMANQQWPHNPALPGGAWQFHSPYAGTPAGAPATTPLILSQPTKPLRVWFTVGDQDAFYPQAYMADGMHDWTLGAHNFAKALATMNYPYQWIFAINSQHADLTVINQTLPYGIEWLWQGYPVSCSERDSSELSHALPGCRPTTRYLSQRRAVYRIDTYMGLVPGNVTTLFLGDDAFK